MALLLAGACLSGCTLFDAPEIPRGALVEKSDILQLHPGSTTQQEVESLIGSPTTHATFDNNKWIYITLTKNLVPMGFPAVDKQRVLVLDFDDSGVLQHLKLLTKKNAVPVSMVSAITPSPGTQISVLQEILGNVGRYNPMSSLGNTFGGGLGGLGGMNNHGGGMGNGPLSGQGTGNGGVGNTMP
ncbi:outer membrane protein assembly factor BamE [Oecophyllibacter saccharovorans]|uniref:outer membrane protein assembly factor BamE n=1 Tax=Oecophyllibacter saccharovorans TaxID=2558360 RepID=UPI001E3323C5|nr:outer membrane protein assembly factor BamE [Oecophyllibacter saccharovorans]